MPATTARDFVTAHLASQARRFPDLEIAGMTVDGLHPRDAALAQAIEHAVLRRWLTLAAVIESQLSRPWDELEPKLQAALLVGAAQLLLLEKLPDHAVLNETVAWAKRNIRAKAGGLVNAVLRKAAGLRSHLSNAEIKSERLQLDRDELLLHNGRVWQLTEPVFDENQMRCLAQQTSHPEALIGHWLTTFGLTQTQNLALHSLVHPPIILHGDSELQPTADEHEKMRIQPHSEPGFFTFEGDRVALKQLLDSHPRAIVQDPASAAPIRATAGLDPPPRLILDACAGRGTKTRQLVATHPDSQIIASDVNQDRLRVLRKQFNDHPHIEIVEYNKLRERFDGKADLLVLDVPCSNTGVLARRVEAKYRQSPTSLKNVCDLQKQIIADSIPLLGHRAHLLYTTCSIEPAENQQQKDWVVKWHKLRIVRDEATLPHGMPGDSPAVYRDGGYFALLRNG